MLWMREEAPVILILYDAIMQHAVWLAIQPYFQEVIPATKERRERQEKLGGPPVE